MRTRLDRSTTHVHTHILVHVRACSVPKLCCVRPVGALLASWPASVLRLMMDRRPPRSAKLHVNHMQIELYICFVCICVDVLYLVVDQNEYEIEIENSNIIYLV